MIKPLIMLGDDALILSQERSNKMVSETSVVQRTLLPTDGDSAYDTSGEIAALINGASTSAYTRIWQYTIPAQTLYRWGYGDPRLPTNQGFMTFAAGVQAGGAAFIFEEGLLRFVVENAPGTARRFQGEIASNGLHAVSPVGGNGGSALRQLLNDRNEMQPFPVGDAEAIMDSKLVMEWRKTTDSGGTVNQCEFRIPATLYA